MIRLPTKLKTPLDRRKYRVMSKSWSTRSWKIAIKCWWKWDVLPWFKKLDYFHGPDGNHKYHYRWQNKK